MNEWPEELEEYCKKWLDDNPDCSTHPFSTLSSSIKAKFGMDVLESMLVNRNSRLWKKYRERGPWKRKNAEGLTLSDWCLTRLKSTPDLMFEDLAREVLALWGVQLTKHQLNTRNCMHWRCPRRTYRSMLDFGRQKSVQPAPAGLSEDSRRLSEEHDAAKCGQCGTERRWHYKVPDHCFEEKAEQMFPDKCRQVMQKVAAGLALLGENDPDRYHQARDLLKAATDMIPRSPRKEI